MSTKSGRFLFRNKAAVFGCGVLFLWSAGSFAQVLCAQSFSVTYLRGDASLGSSQGSYQSAKLHSQYNLPTWGKTGSDGIITASFNADNSFRLLPDSEAEIRGTNDSGSEWHRVVKLHIGEATFDHSSTATPRVDLNCETPTSICGALGTEFSVRATTGEFSVQRGSILISSESERGLSIATSSSTVIYNPGKENTYSSGTVNGTLKIAGLTLHAVNANYIVSKKLGGSDDTAIRIISGSIGGNPPGDYTVNGKLIPLQAKFAGIFNDYLNATKAEGRINAAHAAYQAARLTPPAADDSASLKAAAERATAERDKLFVRGIARANNAAVLQSLQQSH